jgi:hypothetical protein
LNAIQGGRGKPEATAGDGRGIGQRLPPDVAGSPRPAPPEESPLKVIGKRGLGPKFLAAFSASGLPCAVERPKMLLRGQLRALKTSITCRANLASARFEKATAPDFTSLPSEVRVNWKTYSATSSGGPY